MRYAIYARKSTEEDERQAQSIDDQLALAQELAGKHDEHDIVVFSESKSAKEEGRPEFNRMIEMIDRGDIVGVIAWHPDRLSRNETDAAAVTKRVRKGVLKNLLFVNYYFHNSPEGVMMLQMALSQSQYFSSKLSGDVKRGLESKIRKGWWPHRALPGYVNNKHMDKGEKTISRDPVRFLLVRRAFDHVLARSHSPAQVLELLNGQWGYLTPRTRKGGGAPMGKATFYRLLSNVFYAGYFVEKGEIVKGSHEPMITMDEFRRVQEILGRSPRVQPKTHEFPYTGTIYCGSCSHLVTAQINVNRQRHEYTYYRCTRCRGQSVRDVELQEQVDAEVDAVALIPDFVEWAVEEVQGWKKQDRASDHAVYEQKAAALASVGLQLDNLLTALTKQLIGDEEYQERKQKLVAERGALKVDLDKAEIEADRVRQAIENEIDFLANVKLWMAVGDLPMRRACLRTLGSNFTLNGKKMLLEPHPLLVKVREENKGLETKYLAIKLDETLSESKKNELIQPIRSAWSRIWGHNQTLVSENYVTFPRISLPASESCC